MKVVKITDTYPLPFTYVELHTRFPDTVETEKFVRWLDVMCTHYIRELDSKYNTVLKPFGYSNVSEE